MMTHSDASGGQLALDLTPEMTCLSPPLPLYGPVDVRWIENLRRKYESIGILVLIRASPVPACDPQLLQFQHDLAPFVDGNVEADPIEDFVSGDRHTSAAGSQLDSMQLARLIRSRFPELALQDPHP